MQTLKLPNFSSINVLEQSQLTADITAAASSLPVINTQDFDANDTILVGNFGAKSAELLTVSSVTDATDLALSASTTLAHQAYEPVTHLLGNKLRIYRAANVDASQPADTDFTLLDTIDIDPNDAATAYTDGTGGGDYWYKYTFYNSNSTSETDLGSAKAVRGSFTVDYCSIDEIREEAGFKYAPYVTDSMIDAKRQAAQDDINGALQEFYDVPFQPPINDDIRDICKRLAAGLLLKQQYGQTVTNPESNGTNKYNDATAELEKFVTKQRVIVSKDGQSLAGSGTSEIAAGWPDASTATAASNDGGAPRVFRMGDIQGQPINLDPSGNPVGNLYFGRKW